MSAYEFKLPDVGEGLSEGEIVRWHVASGERVAADQIMVDVETDKAVVELPAPVAGILTKQGGQPGDVLPVGALLAVIETDGVAPAETPAPEPDKPAAPAPEPKKPKKRVLASPATRKLAVELDVDIATMTGTGADGRVTRADVESAAKSPAASVEPAPAIDVPSTEEDKVVPLRGLRRQIAKTMMQAWREIPHITAMREIDADRLVAARRSLRAEFEDSGVTLSYLPLFVKAAVVALKRHPSFNASIDMAREEIVYRHRYNIGVATATPDGLIVTVVHDADRLSLLDIARRIDTLAQAARERKASPAQLTGGTFTISNFGSYGGWMGTPIIRPPEVAIAGFGRIREAVVPVDGVPAVRSLLPLVVSTDHRLNDGEHMGGFMGTLETYLSDPVRLLGQL